MALSVSTTLTILDEMDSDNGVGVLETDFAYSSSGCIGIDVDIETWVLENVSVTPPPAVDMSTATHIYAAMLCMTQPTLDLEANGGMGIGVIDGSDNWKVWFVGGKDTYTGGWDVRSAYTGNTHDDASATLPVMTDIRGIVTYWKCTQKSKLAQNCFMDRTAYGNGAALIVTGTNAVTNEGWSEVLSVADSVDATRGYLKAQTGSYVPKGSIQIGDSAGTASTTFTDDFNILIFSDSPVSSTSNYISGKGNSTGTTSITLSSQVLKSAGQRFAFDMSDTNLTSFLMTGSTLANAGLVDFKAGQTITGCVFNDCGQIDPSTSTFENDTISNYSGSEGGALLWPGGTSVNACTFDNNLKSIEVLQTSSQTYDALTFVGEDDSTKQSTHLNNGGTDIDISKNNGSNPQYYTATGGGVVSFIGSSTTMVLKAQTGAGTEVVGARAFLRTAAAGSLPYDITVTIVNSGTTATVTHTSHGMNTGDKVVISGASLIANLGVFSITVTGTDTYTYTMGSTPGSSPTGTIKCSFVFVEGITDGNGEVSASRVYPADQAAVGSIRKSSGSPYYKSAPLSGTVSSTVDKTFTGVMISDD